MEGVHFLCLCWWIVMDFKKFYRVPKSVIPFLVVTEPRNNIVCVFIQWKELSAAKKRIAQKHAWRIYWVTVYLTDLTCLWLGNFRMWHRRLSTPPSWNTSSLASSRFFRMEKCSSFKKNLHRCVARNKGLGCIPTLMDFCLVKVHHQQQLCISDF